jgi:hypothetical protein
LEAFKGFKEREDWWNMFRDTFFKAPQAEV